MRELFSLLTEDEVPELDTDDFAGDGSEVPLAVMVKKCVAGDDIGEDFARNEEGGMVSTSSVEGVEEDLFKGEDIEPISKTQDGQEEGRGRHTKKLAKCFQGPNWLLSDIVKT
jgi:hypothetical protein